ncbi:hypothetical protein CAG54_12125 [Vibrio sp. V27_P1S3P104]|uniref:hypothetical protein n=1 Tax=unclassified Vibrio TaxID=2614977 RepID=UPI00137304BE|nr:MULTISPECIES: hypothetical protein [unclassified Vibrio]NAW69124.1 hypothetical protein [Vibrio sp. V28_P6S34P95]NAX06366.1 hypothetical protein [Vibrio sp. V30_P3S12P165]NAX34021.1 hypothetical protein [Vibrio sp. V29_P1S30P107]NAX38247.1 hypothetical protein [Vibrio sp. V27_P1S3P104]NAX40436.1 hypothetical protein [Vibrio sp. V26_P1S5P106]
MLHWLWIVAWLWAASAQAAHPTFIAPFLQRNVPFPSFETIEQSPYWFACGERATDKRWCSDPFYYYSVSVWASIGQDADQPVVMTMYSDYSSSIWSQLQLGLRRDGFSLGWVKLGDNEFDVIERREDESWQELDRALIVFLNRNVNEFPKTQRWLAQQRQVQLKTDGIIIELQWIYINNRS